MGRNHVNYFFGKYGIQPMSPAMTRNTYAVFSGTLCQVYEKISIKQNGTFHWLALGFDDDGLGPTKHLFCNVSNDKEILWLIQMSRSGRVLERGDELTIEYSGQSVSVFVNGEPGISSSKKTSLLRMLYRCRIRASLNEILQDVCSWALPTKVSDELEDEAAYRCREFLCDMISDSRGDELKAIINKLLPIDCASFSFLELYKELKKLDTIYDESFEEKGESECKEEEECLLRNNNEFAVNDFDE